MRATERRGDSGSRVVRAHTRAVWLLAWMALCLLALVLLPRFAQAQVGPFTLAKAWPAEPTWSDTDDEILVFKTAPYDPDDDRHARVFFWDSHGRVKPVRSDPTPDVVIGYKILTMNVSANDPLINGALNDIALAVGGKLVETPGLWSVEVMAGMGTANDGHWYDTDALYGVGTVSIAKVLDPYRKLHLGLTLDGNLGLLPSVPLPFISYAWKPTERMDLYLGFPEMAFQTPIGGPFALSGGYRFPVDVDLRVECLLPLGFRLFAEYERTLDSFFINDRGHRRLFYQFDRLGGGVRWISSWLDISVGGGYAFNHEFSVGYDLRSLTREADLMDGWYFSIEMLGSI
jgi:hypothetical protein